MRSLGRNMPVYVQIGALRMQIAYLYRTNIVTQLVGLLSTLR